MKVSYQCVDKKVVKEPAPACYPQHSCRQARNQRSKYATAIKNRIFAHDITMEQLDEKWTRRSLEAYNGKVVSDVGWIQELLPKVSLHWSNRFFLPRKHHRTKERRQHCCVARVQAVYLVSELGSRMFDSISFQFTQASPSVFSSLSSQVHSRPLFDSRSCRTPLISQSISMSCNHCKPCCPELNVD